MELPDVRTWIQRGTVRLANLATHLPGERPPWVVVDIRGSYPAREVPRRLFKIPPELGSRDPSLEKLGDELRALADADWCEGVILRFGQASFGTSAANALRARIEELRAAGKRTVAYLAYPSLLAYWVATSADRVVASGAETTGAWGLAMESLYWGRAFERAGVGFDRVRIREYKTAFESFARATMSEPQREQLTALLEDVEETMRADVARSRGQPQAVVEEWLESPPTRRDAMVERGLVDAVGYEDEVVPENAARLPQVTRFLRRRVPPDSGRVAVVSLTGAIVPGESRRSPMPVPLVGGTFAGSETVVRALRAAGDDDRTEAVVFHVDSSGGSALASDLIWREVQLLDRRKPVVAVMGDVAASGGYYVLTHARRVLAAPTTITGSIGVIAGKFVLRDLFERLGIAVERIVLHRFADVHSSSRPFDDEERAFVEESIQETYTQFIRRVAEGRGMNLERVDEIARGRVWSGRAALEIGLVDELGDVEAGIARARELAGLPAHAPAWNVRPPRVAPLPHDPQEAGALLRQVASERLWLLPAVDPRIRG